LFRRARGLTCGESANLGAKTDARRFAFPGFPASIQMCTHWIAFSIRVLVSATIWHSRAFQSSRHTRS